MSNLHQAELRTLVNNGTHPGLSHGSNSTGRNPLFGPWLPPPAPLFCSWSFRVLHVREMNKILWERSSRKQHHENNHCINHQDETIAKSSACCKGQIPTSTSSFKKWKSNNYFNFYFSKASWLMTNKTNDIFLCSYLAYEYFLFLRNLLKYLPF